MQVIIIVTNAPAGLCLWGDTWVLGTHRDDKVGSMRDGLFWPNRAWVGGGRTLPPPHSTSPEKALIVMMYCPGWSLSTRPFRLTQPSLLAGLLNSSFCTKSGGFSTDDPGSHRDLCLRA